MKSALVHPSGPLKGELQVPGDKSISHRAALLSGLAGGQSTIQGFLPSEDCLSSLAAMTLLGAEVEHASPTALSIRGVGSHAVRPSSEINAGNSGTTIRLLAGILAGQPFQSTMTGDASLLSRPMTRIQTPLEAMGATVELLGEGGRGPVRITGGSLSGITYRLPMASAQVKSCVLLAGLFADGESQVIEPRPTRDHTERMLRQAGIELHVDGLEITLKGQQQVQPAAWNIPGDFSSAAFFMLAVAARPGSLLILRGVGLNPRRTAFLDVLHRMGAKIQVERTVDQEGGEPHGVLHVEGGCLNGVEVGGDEIPNLIDELPLVAVAGALASGQTVIRDAAELRVKESDRIATMVANLRAFNVEVEEHKDGMTIHGGGALRAASPVESYGDHRIAMAMAVLSLFAEAPVCIRNIACTETSYPGFWTHLKELGAHVE